jgi:hypothetical protein
MAECTAPVWADATLGAAMGTPFGSFLYDLCFLAVAVERNSSAAPLDHCAPSDNRAVLVAMALPPSIPAVSSRPADPNTISFFTLPAELRNRVYGFLGFDHVDPLFIIGWSTRHHGQISGYSGLLRPLLKTFGDTYRDDDWLSTRNPGLSMSHPQHGKFLRAYHFNISFLRSCQQAYAEAASSFYMANTFHFFSRDTSSGFLDCRDWIRVLGSQSQMLRKLVIELPDRYPTQIGPTLPTWTRDYWGVDFGSIEDGTYYVDIGPLVRLLWRYHINDQIIQFSDKGATDTVVATNISAMLRAFQKDELGVKTPLIKHIAVNNQGSHGVILYSTTHTQRSYHHQCEREFVQYFHGYNIGGSSRIQQFIGNNGKSFQVQARPPVGLMQLPKRLLRRIVTLAAGSYPKARINLTKHQTNLDLGLAHTNRRLRELYLNLAFDTQLTLELSSSQISTSFEKFEAIWQYHRAWTTPFKGWSWCARRTRIVLCFDLTEPATLEDLRIQATDFAMATINGMANQVEVRIKIRTMGASADWKEVAGTTFTLEDFRREARRVLLWATNRPRGAYNPETAVFYRRGVRDDAGETLQMYLDGHGRITRLGSSVSPAIVKVPKHTGTDLYALDYLSVSILGNVNINSGFDDFKHYQQWANENPDPKSEGWSTFQLIQRLTYKLRIPRNNCEYLCSSI